MYNTKRMIESGRQTIRRHPRRDITGAEMRSIHDQANGDEYQFAMDCFLIGVAIGKRIAEAEAKEANK